MNIISSISNKTYASTICISGAIATACHLTKTNNASINNIRNIATGIAMGATALLMFKNINSNLHPPVLPKMDLYGTRLGLVNSGGPQSGSDSMNHDESHIASIWPRNDPSKMGCSDGPPNSPNPAACRIEDLKDLKAELAQGIEITPMILEKIQKLLPIIQTKTTNPQIQRLTNTNIDVFRITEFPHLIFKMKSHQSSGESWINGKWLTSDQEIPDRFENMLKAKGVCLTHKLDLITMPQAKMFTITVDGISYSIIAEQALDIEGDGLQKNLYKTHAQSLFPAIKQAFTFIRFTGFNDFVWRNVPVLNEFSEFQGHHRLAFIDFDLMNKAKGGILGDPMNGSRGLIRCLFCKKQIDAILDLAIASQIITKSEADEVKLARMKELEN